MRKWREIDSLHFLMEHLTRSVVVSIYTFSHFNEIFLGISDNSFGLDELKI